MRKLPLILSMILMVGCDGRKVPSAEPTKRDLFELKEKCADSVPRVTKWAVDYGENTTLIRTHYNATLNRCYVLIKWQIPKTPTFLLTLVDAQSFAHQQVKEGDPILASALEGEDIDAVVPAMK